MPIYPVYFISLFTWSKQKWLFLKGRLLSSQSEQSETFSKSSDWLEKSRVNRLYYMCKTKWLFLKVSVHYLEKNYVISSVRKHYCALGMGLGLAKVRFRAGVVELFCRTGFCQPIKAV